MARTTAVLLALAVVPAAAAAQRLAPPTLHVGATIPARVSWRASDVALAGAFVVALAIDAAQTRSIAQGGWQGYREMNPILGPHPSVGQVNTYTAVAGLTVLGAAAVVPARSEEHTSELQSRLHLVCRLLLEKKKNKACVLASLLPVKITTAYI